MARAKITTTVKDALNNFYKLMGVSLGSLVKEAHGGALSSYTRVAFTEDFIGDSIGIFDFKDEIQYLIIPFFICNIFTYII